MLFTSEDAAAQILDLPNAPTIIKEVQKALTVEEKKRRHFYKTVTEQEKAEFINGEIVVHSPVIKMHNKSSGLLYKLIDTYVDINDLGFTGIEKILIKLTRNDYEPDLCFFKKEKAEHFQDREMFFPAPDFVVEVLSKSTEQRDRGSSLETMLLMELRNIG